MLVPVERLFALDCSFFPKVVLKIEIILFVTIKHENQWYYEASYFSRQNLTDIKKL